MDVDFTVVYMGYALRVIGTYTRGHHGDYDNPPEASIIEGTVWLNDTDVTDLMYELVDPVYKDTAYNSIMDLAVDVYENEEEDFDDDY